MVTPQTCRLLAASSIALAATLGCGSSASDDAGTSGTDDAARPADAAIPADAGEPEACGYQGRGRILVVAEDIEICLPPVVCTPATCPPPLGDCVDGACVFAAGYSGLKTWPEAWATHYCDLSGTGCHGVSQVNYPEETAAMLSSALGLPLCFAATPGTTRCVGIVASPPMMVGNSEMAIDPSTGHAVVDWGLGMTEASGWCYEIRGPGGAAVVAATDRCGGYCSCGASGFQECGPCVNAADMTPNCACVGPVPGLHEECCGRGCPATDPACDWCASNNHPHFDLDIATFDWVCGDEAPNGSCRLTFAKPTQCLPPNPDWPPNAAAACGAEDNTFFCDGVAPAPEQPVVPGTPCCCNWGLTPQPDGTCA